MQYFKKTRRMDKLLLFSVSAVSLAMLVLGIGGHFYDARAPLTSGCGTETLSNRVADLLRKKPRVPAKSRFIAVVGDGVPGESVVVDRPYNTQFAQGYDLYQGVQHALTTMRGAEYIPELAVLFVDDGGNSVCARQIAEVLAKEPALLGVIGHSTTSCTQAALPIYQLFHIPVLIPAATNPALLEGHADHAFRLPANDSIQALVIADFVLTHLKARSIFVVWDATPEAQQYAEYLKTRIPHYLTLLAGNSPGVIVEGSYPISLNPLNYSYLFRRIVSSEPGVVIFAGYGSLAREFLLGLDEEYGQYLTPKSVDEEPHAEPPLAPSPSPGQITTNKEASVASSSLVSGPGAPRRPVVILTDGCKIPGITGYRFATYVAFPSAPLATLPAFASFKPGPRIARHQRMYLDESYEMYGYDAAVLLLGAIKGLHESGRSVSRHAVIERIAEPADWPLAGSYTFMSGENTEHAYDLYSLARDLDSRHYDSTAIAALLRRVTQP